MSGAILGEIRDMSVEERLRLIGEIWDTVDPEELQLSPDQLAVLDRRLEAHRKNPSAGRPWEDVKRDIRSRL